MRTFRKFLESCEPINEAEYNKEWWDSKSDSFKQRYIERHPNSIYAQKANLSNQQKKDITKFVGQAFGKDSKAAKTAKANLDDTKKKEAPKKKESQREIQLRARDPKTSIEELNKLADTQKSAWVNWSIAENPNATPEILDKISNRLLNMGENNQSRWSDAWFGAINTIINHKNASKELIKKFENGDSDAQFAILASPKVSKEFLDKQIDKLDPWLDNTWVMRIAKNPNLDPQQIEKIKEKAKEAQERLNSTKTGSWSPDHKWIVDDTYKKEMNSDLNWLKYYTGSNQTYDEDDE